MLDGKMNTIGSYKRIEFMYVRWNIKKNPELLLRSIRI